MKQLGSTTIVPSLIQSDYGIRHMELISYIMTIDNMVLQDFLNGYYWSIPPENLSQT